MTYAFVHPDVLIDKPLLYTIPDHIELVVGDRVTVPLQKKEIKATVISLSNDKGSINPLEIIKKHPTETLPLDLLSLMQWMKSYYLCPFFKLTQLFFPAAVRKESNPFRKVYIKRNIPLNLFETKFFEKKNDTPQSKVMSLFRKSNRPIRLSTLLEKSCTSKSPVDTLIREGILMSYESVDDEEFTEYVSCKEKVLNEEQEHAFSVISTGVSSNLFTPYLLHGVTGSGKTEVYIKLMKLALSQGKQVLYLVPEVGLTGQTVDRLRAHFPKQIALFHHRISGGKKHEAWKACLKGEIPIVLGARSGAFVPLPNLGLVIIDEEHDGSYKQTEEMPCYHARDVAIKRASLAQATVVLGSATPSAESYHNAKTGKYQYVTLKHRPSFATLPKIEIIDKTTEYEQQHLFSPKLLNAMEKALEEGHQAMLFLNRRGSFSALVCKSCEDALQCCHCTARLTLHERDGSLQCHLCGYSIPSQKAKCHKCSNGDLLKFKSPGTQFIEKSINAIFPQFRTLRMDSDTTNKKGDHERLYKKFRSGQADILIGTQMLSKGFDFPNVTVVGVLFADLSLHIPEYRAQETTFQLLSQVSGRAGRGHAPGTVYIQTALSSHPLFRYIKKESYSDFMNEELCQRKLCGYPPFQKMARFLFSGSNESEVRSLALEIRDKLLFALPQEMILTPVVPRLTAKVNNDYRYQFLLKGSSLKSCIERWPNIQKRLPKSRTVKLLIDINPLATL